MRKLLLALTVRGVGSLLQLLANLVLGRLFGAAAVGIFYLYHTYATFFGAAGAMGISDFLLREVARREQDRAHRVDRLIATGAVLATGGGTLMALILLPVMFLFARDEVGHLDRDTFLAAAMVGTLSMAVSRVLFDVLKARRLLNLSFALEFSLPFLAVTLGGIIGYAARRDAPSEALLWPILGHVCAVSVTAVSFLLFVLIREKIHADDFGREYLTRWREISHFWSATIANWSHVLAPYVVLPMLVGLDDIGGFAICQRLVGLINTINLTLQGGYAPVIVRAYEGTGQDLGRLYTRVTLYNAVLSLPVLAGLVLLPELVLRLFGPDFPPYGPILVLLASARLAATIFGIPEIFLRMSGRPGWEAFSLALSLLLFFVLSLGLGYADYGAEGVAVALGVMWVTRAGTSFLLARINWKRRAAGSTTALDEQRENDVAIH